MHNPDQFVTDPDVAFYQEQGYWIGLRILSDEQLAILRENHAAVSAGQYETGHAPHSRSVPAGDSIDTKLKIDNAHWADSQLVRLLSGQDGEPFAGPYFPVLYRATDNANPWDVPS